MAAKGKIAGLIVTALVLAAPMVYAGHGNQGNFAKGQSGQAGCCTFSHKESDCGHGCKMHGKMKKKMANKMDLTDEQQKQLQQYWQKQRGTIKSSFKDMNSNREALNRELEQSMPDMNKINDIQAQFKAMQSQIADEHLNSMLEVKKILTPEQFREFLKVKEHKMSSHHGYGKHHYKHDWESRK